MRLTRLQERLYRSRCVLYRPGEAVDNGYLQATVFALQKSPRTNLPLLFPCAYEFTPNVDDPTNAGRLKRFTLFTTDKISFGPDCPIGNGWLVMNVTVFPDGEMSSNWGTFHSVLGDPQYIDSARKQCRLKVSVEAMSIEHTPDWLEMPDTLTLQIPGLPLE